MSIGATVIELRIFNKKEKKNMDAIFCYNFGHKWYFSERFGIQLSFDMCCAVKALKVKNFNMCGGNINTIAIPIHRVLYHTL